MKSVNYLSPGMDGGSGGNKRWREANGDVVPKVTASLEGLSNGGSFNPTVTQGPVTVTSLISYAYDFGEGQFQYRKSQLEDQLKKTPRSGGNSMRLWIHIQGETSPAFDGTGMVTGLDTKGSFINDFKELLSLALKVAGSNPTDSSYFEFFGLPNRHHQRIGPHHRLDGLVKDPVKLQSYIDNALTPLVKAVNGHPALGGWDIINEPEGMINPEVANDDPCFNTTSLHNSGGWLGRTFINWQAAAIKAVDSKIWSV
ncbi:hypothetical protein Btru_047296 [Bulinus truncatus]|nr:hypothetical protein Btru_047296 [Bulinus truncatus]